MLARCSRCLLSMGFISHRVCCCFFRGICGLCFNDKLLDLRFLSFTWRKNDWWWPHWTRNDLAWDLCLVGQDQTTLIWSGFAGGSEDNTRGRNFTSERDELRIRWVGSGFCLRDLTYFRWQRPWLLRKDNFVFQLFMVAFRSLERCADPFVDGEACKVGSNKVIRKLFTADLSCRSRVHETDNLLMRPSARVLCQKLDMELVPYTSFLGIFFLSLYGHRRKWKSSLDGGRVRHSRYERRKTFLLRKLSLLTTFVI